MKRLLTLYLLISTLCSCAQNPKTVSDAVYMEVDWIQMPYYPDCDESYSIRVDDQTLYIGCIDYGIINLDSTSLAGKRPPHFKEFAKGKSAQQLKSDLEELSQGDNHIFLIKHVDSNKYVRFKAKKLYIHDHIKPSNHPYRSAQFITNAIEQGSRFIIVDSRNSTTKLSEDFSFYDGRVFIRTLSYDLYDCDHKLCYISPLNDERLNDSNEVTAFTIAHSALNLKGDWCIDLDKFASTNERNAIEDIFRLQPKNKTDYLIDRAEMTENMVVVREITDLGYWLIDD